MEWDEPRWEYTSQIQIQLVHQNQLNQLNPLRQSELRQHLSEAPLLLPPPWAARPSSAAWPPVTAAPSRMQSASPLRPFIYLNASRCRSRQSSACLSVYTASFHLLARPLAKSPAAPLSTRSRSSSLCLLAHPRTTPPSTRAAGRSCTAPPSAARYSPPLLPLRVVSPSSRRPPPLLHLQVAASLHRYPPRAAIFGFSLLAGNKRRANVAPNVIHPIPASSLLPNKKTRITPSYKPNKQVGIISSLKLGMVSSHPHIVPKSNIC